MQRYLSIIDRLTKKEVLEKVYKPNYLHFLYGQGWFGTYIASIALFFIRLPLFSYFYGLLQKRKSTRKKIAPFIEEFSLNKEEFEKNIEDFSSFDDFFIRKLKQSYRPFTKESDKAILPCDGRYLVYENFHKAQGLYIKGKKFSLQDFVQSKQLKNQYHEGTIIIARLAPCDYHRIHFPFDTVPSESKKISGYLYSVNPIAIKQNINIFCQNKRVMTTLFSEVFGEVLFIEVGATNVGSIHQTFTPNNSYNKGEEKGYFSFGGSSVVMLFEKGRIKPMRDLLDNSLRNKETLCHFGQELGKAHY